jgi:3'(2'), 5'-bisphosphate nucleotidase
VEDSRLADAHLARALADQAGELLLAVRDPRLDSAELKRRGDAQSHQLLMAELAKSRPLDAVLSEEGKDNSARLAAERVWIVDPLDGTREYSEPPRDDWAVHVALWQAGALIAGAVALPARGVTYASDQEITPPKSGSGPLRLAVSRSRPPEFVTALAQSLGAELIPMGSAGVKATAVLADDVDAYVHAGGQYEWDSAAPVAVCAAAGLHTSRIDGSPLQYNQADPLLPDLLICKSEIASQILAAISELAANAGVK